MKYGFFDDVNKEYVINTYDTPLPWINYLGQNDFFSLISNTLGGYSFYKDAKLRRLTRYRYNNVPNDISGRFYYIKDKDTIWNIGYLPSKTKLDKYECRHGLGYSKFFAKKGDIETNLTCFVPLKGEVEINVLNIRNTGLETKTIDLFAMCEFCMYNTIDDSTNFQRNLNIAEVEVDDNTIYHKTEYRERRDHYTFLYSSRKHDSYQTDRSTFLGVHGGFDSPKEVLEGKCSNVSLYGGEPIGCHHHHLTIKPHEEVNIVFLFGYVEEHERKFDSLNVINKTNALKLIDRFNTVDKVNNELDALKNHWNNLLSKFHVNTGNEKFDRMANIWNQYQCMITYCMSRSASYFESGTGRGMGFRDSCQDLLGFVHLIPERARERIIDIASIQFEDGSTYHQYQPLTKTGNADIGSGFNDDPLWLVGAVSAYIKETNDYSILDEMVPFNNVKGSEKTLYEHLLISLNYTMTHLGPHNLPLIGRADWNDCLNLNCFSETPGESFQTTANFESGKAESVFIAGMFVKYGNEFIDLANRINKVDDAKKVAEAVKKIEQATITDGWDGEYFLRAYDAYCNKVGSHECEEGKIYIEPQGFCVLAGIGHDLGYGKKTLASVEKYLVNDYGVEILHPCYTTYHVELGEISSYPPGHKENGSVFCHNNPWITLAYCKEGMGEEAFRIYSKNAPAFLEDKSDIHQTEPYVYSQTIAGRDSVRYGQARNSWLTGTASWSFVALSQGILGVVPTLDGLSINPCLPSSMKEVNITRTYQGNVYNFHIVNNKGNKTITVNGKLIEGNVIKNPEKINNVEVIL